jgi:vancomycin resistance protein VanW
VRHLILAAIALASVAGSTALLSRSTTTVQLLSTFSTSFDGRLKDQVHNATLAAKKLNGTLVRPGETLSFNKTVGTWSRDQGYRKAPVSFSGTLVDSWGGGVCQTSSTLYNAALLAGFDVVERHHHQFAPNYVPPGRDAAVAYPSIDLKVRNPYPYPVRVRARAESGRLTIEFLGRGPAPKVAVVQRVRQVREPGLFVLGKGTFARVRNPGKTGFQVEVYRLAGGERELLSSDSYPAMSRVVEYRSGLQ